MAMCGPVPTLFGFGTWRGGGGQKHPDLAVLQEPWTPYWLWFPLGTCLLNFPRIGLPIFSEFKKWYFTHLNPEPLNSQYHNMLSKRFPDHGNVSVSPEVILFWGESSKVVWLEGQGSLFHTPSYFLSRSQPAWMGLISLQKAVLKVHLSPGWIKSFLVSNTLMWNHQSFQSKLSLDKKKRTGHL